MTPTQGTASPAATWFALVTVYLVWGSTYLAIRVVVESAPPLLSMGVRFVVAGALLAAFLALRSGPGVLRVTWRELGSAGLVGVLLLLCGNGAVAVAEQTVPSGLAALLVAATPLWLVCLRLAARDRPRAWSLAGTVLGFAGIAVLARPGGQGGDVEAWGVALIVGATVAWAVGSFFSSRLPMPANPFVATMWEMTVGGGLMVLAGVGRGELSGFSLDQVEPAAWAWLGYLVVFGSLAAFTAYVWLLHNAPISLTATYAYVNPVVAVVLGALILSEPVTTAIVVGGSVVVLGVGLVVSTERPRREAPVPAPGPAPDVIGPDLPAATSRARG
jgi:drug/metabolite transporter (DMT)-like permease